MASSRFKRTGQQAKHPEGELRQSQLVTTFGPGAMVDLVDHAVVIGGLEHWGFGDKGFVSLDDARLRAALVRRLKSLDPDLELAQHDYFRKPPSSDKDDLSPKVGVMALEFPRWFVCQGCKRLAGTGFSDRRKGKRHVHDCAEGKSSYAVPVRFVAACKRGHLDDFPWVWFAHHNRKDKESCAAPELYLYENALGDVTGIFVRCKGCGAEASMNQASILPLTCKGQRPWLGGNAAAERCDERQELLVRSASHAYFAQVVSALRLPPLEPDPLRQRLRATEVWKAVHAVTTVAQVNMLSELIAHVKNAVEGYAPERVVEAIRDEHAADPSADDRPLRSAEYERITAAPIEQPGNQPGPDVQFAAFRLPSSRVALPKGVSGLVVVPELREVRVQVSFSRFDSIGANLQGEYEFEGRAIKPTVLTMPTGNEKWLPAAEVRGEGIFVELDPEALARWEESELVKRRAEQLFRGHEQADSRGGAFPGVRFYLLHSLAHLLLTSISLECGYAASAIRERIYCGKRETEGLDMAAVMLSTGTTGSEGTLGGLVEEGRRIAHHLREAWDLGRLCSNDPVCAAHDPSREASDRRTEGAACHGCLYIAECSCEWFNKHLDRALVVPTIGSDPSLAFFRERP